MVMPLLGLSSLYVTLFDHPLESFISDLEDHNDDVRVGEVVNFKSTILNEQNIAILKKVKDVQLTVHSALDIPSEICNPDLDARKGAIKMLKKSIDYSADIGAVAFVQHPGSKTVDVENGWDLNSESLLSLIDHGNSRGIRVLIENMPPQKAFMCSPSEFNEFIKTNNVNLSIAFDTGHSHIAGNIDEFIEKLSSRFFMVHVTDNDGISDSHLNVGEGTINWKKLVGDLKKLQFNGMYVVEAARDPMKSISALKELLK